MLPLLAFLSRYRNAILFLLLEIIALLIVVQFNARQRYLLGDIGMSLAGSVQEVRANAVSYLGLKEENDDLKDENIRLRQRILQLSKELNVHKNLAALDSTKDRVIQPFLSREIFEHIPCKAIKHSTYKNYNYITIDKGSRHGIEKNAGIISPEGIAGRIVSVGKDYSIALSLLNLDFELSVRSLKTRNVGIYEWTGQSTRYAKIKAIPLDVNLAVGDTIITTGSSTIFPEGYLVGAISEINDNTGTGFHDITVKLSTDFHTLRNLYVVKATHRAFLQNLEKQINIKEE